MHHAQRCHIALISLLIVAAACSDNNECMSGADCADDEQCRILDEGNVCEALNAGDGDGDGDGDSGPRDGGTTTDGGQDTTDAGQPANDAGQTANDAGQTANDAGQTADDAGPGPVVTRFDIDGEASVTVLTGTTVTLDWESTGATGCTLTDSIGSEAITLEPTATTTALIDVARIFTLTCRDESDRSDSANVDALVTLPVSIDTFSLDGTDADATIAEGASAVLAWTSTGALGQCALFDGDMESTVDANGMQTVTPAATTTYTLTCPGLPGEVVQARTLTVAPPVQILSFTIAGMGEVTFLDEVAASPAVLNATRCDIEGEDSLSGEVTVLAEDIAPSGALGVTVRAYPDADQIFRLVCQGPGGPVQMEVVRPVENVVCMGSYDRDNFDMLAPCNSIVGGGLTIASVAPGFVVDLPRLVSSENAILIFDTDVVSVQLPHFRTGSVLLSPSNNEAVSTLSSLDVSRLQSGAFSLYGAELLTAVDLPRLESAALFGLQGLTPCIPVNVPLLQSVSLSMTMSETRFAPLTELFPSLLLVGEMTATNHNFSTDDIAAFRAQVAITDDLMDETPTLATCP